MNQQPDLYLDKLKEMLKISCGASVLCSTIWQRLCQAGFTMKKVSISPFEFTSICGSSDIMILSSSPALQQSNLQKSILSISQELASTVQNSSFLLMSLQSIAGLHTEVVHGLFEVLKPSEKLFSSVGDGRLSFLNRSGICIDFQVFP